MATSDLPQRLLVALKPATWSTTHELATALGVSDSNARKHLIALVVQGRVERTEDPWGAPGYTWRLMETPIGKAPTTEQLLCGSCAVAAYRDIVRYREALTAGAFERWNEAADHIGEDEDLIPPCAKCGQRIV